MPPKVALQGKTLFVVLRMTPRSGKAGYATLRHPTQPWKNCTYRATMTQCSTKQLWLAVSDRYKNAHWWLHKAYCLSGDSKRNASPQAMFFVTWNTNLL